MNYLFRIKYYGFFSRIIKTILTASLFAISTFSYAAEDVTNKILLPTDNSAIKILSDMQHAVLNSDYQIYFLTQDANQFSNTLQYRFLGSNHLKYGDLLYLEGAPKEIVLQSNIVSYFQSESASFSLSANKIIEVFPDFIYNNFNKLNEYYDFVLLGKARTANRSSQLIRIVPKDKDRYNYVIWIDEQSHLPLRIDLLDFDSKVINQMKVIELDLDFDKKSFQHDIEKRDYPILVPVDINNNEQDSWIIDWLPSGFKENKAYNISHYQTNIDTKLFSDGIFSFTINITPSLTEDKSYFITQGEITIFSMNLNNMNIVIIGNLPLETIERIANSVKKK